MEDRKQTKSDASSPNSFHKQKNNSSSNKQEATLSSYGKQRVVEDVEQLKVETKDHHKPEAKMDVPNQVGSVAPVITNRKHEVVSHSVGGTSTSSIQQPQFQLPAEQSGYSTLSAYVQSFQPYIPQPKEVMYYSQGLSFPSPVDHPLGPQFVNLNGFPPLHVQNDFRKSEPKVAVKITHPETKEELKLDQIAKGRKETGSSSTRTQVNGEQQLQAYPVNYGHYNLMNYFPHMQPDPLSLQNSTPVAAFSRKEMFPTAAQISQNYLDMQGGVVGSNSVNVSSAPIPFNAMFGYAGEKVSYSVPVKSVVNGNNQAVISRRSSRNQGKLKIQPEIANKPPQKVMTKPTNSAVSSRRGNPSVVIADQGVGWKAVTDGNKSKKTGHSDFIKKDCLGNQEDMEEVHQQQPQQLKNSNLSKLVSLEIGESPNEISTPLKDLKQSDCVHESPLMSECTISRDAKLAEPHAGPSLEIQPHEGVNVATKVGNANSLEHISRKDGLRYNAKNAGRDSIGVAGKRWYSRSFLLTFSSQFVELPADFKLVDDMLKVLILGSDSVGDHGHKIQEGRACNKTTTSASELEEQSVVIGENFNPRSITGGNYSRNGKKSDLLDGSFGSSSTMTGHNRGRRSKWPDADRGLLSLPQSCTQVMHKAERKYEVRKVSDDEEAKQRQLKAILNKLTPQNFDRLFQQVREVKIDNATTLSGLISQIFDKALMEPTFCEMYASFCWNLAGALPDFVEGHQKITFKRLLLNKCQEEFVRGEREEAEATRIEEHGENKLSKEEREEKRIQARRRMLGNIRLIGELYKKRMLTERVLRECMNKLLGDYHNPDEEDIEALCKLMTTVGEIIDHPKAKDQIDAYFATMKSLSRNAQLSSRIRFMLKDVIDLRNNKWKQRRQVEGPKKIEELHSDAAQERRALINQLTSSPTFASSNRRVPVPGNLEPGSSEFQSPPPPHSRQQNHGFGSQDVRLDDGKQHQNHHGTVPGSSPRSSEGKYRRIGGNQNGVSSKKMSIGGGQTMSRTKAA